MADASLLIESKVGGIPQLKSFEQALTAVGMSAKPTIAQIERFDAALIRTAERLEKLKTAVFGTGVAEQKLTDQTTRSSEATELHSAKLQKLTTSHEKAARSVGTSDAVMRKFYSANAKMGEVAEKHATAMRNLSSTHEKTAATVRNSQKDWTDMFSNLLNARTGAEGVLGAMLRLGTGAYLVVRGLQTLYNLLSAVPKVLVENAAAMETMAKSYSVLTSTQVEGEDLLLYIKKLSTEIPVTVSAMDRATRTLLGFGFSAKEVKDVMLTLADVTQGNSSNFEHLALVYGQVRGQGKAMQQDIYQFVNAGIPIMEALADVMGTTTMKIRELTRAGEIGLPEFEAALTKLTAEGGRFYKFTEAMADTFEGRLTIAVNTWKLALSDIGTSVLPLLTVAAEKFVSVLTPGTIDAPNLKAVLGSEGAKGDITAAIAYTEKRAAEIRRLMDLTTKDFRYNLFIDVKDLQKELFQLKEDQFKLSDIALSRLGTPAAGAGDKGTTFRYGGRESAVDATMRDLSKYNQMYSNEKTRIALGMSESDMYQKLADSAREYVPSLLALKDTDFKAGIAFQGINDAFLQPLFDFIVEMDRLAAKGKGMGWDWDMDTPWRTETSLGEMVDFGSNQEFLDIGLRHNVLPVPMNRGPSATPLGEMAFGATEVPRRNPWELIPALPEGESWWAEEEATRLAEMYQAVENLKGALGDLAANSGLDALFAMGELFVNGAAGADDFAAAIGNIGLSLLKQLPQMFLSAGLTILINSMGKDARGWGLIALAAGTSVVSGIASANADRSEKAASGSGVTANALGNIYGSSGLISAFASGGIVSSPTLFNHAGGFGVMGEKGPEAIMPVTRTASGKLGVSAVGGSTSIVVIDQSTRVNGVSATTEETTNSSGGKQIRVVLRDTVRSMIANGELDTQLKTRGVPGFGGVRRS